MKLTLWKYFSLLSQKYVKKYINKIQECSYYAEAYTVIVKTTLSCDFISHNVTLFLSNSLTILLFFYFHNKEQWVFEKKVKEEKAHLSSTITTECKNSPHLMHLIIKSHTFIFKLWTSDVIWSHCVKCSTGTLVFISELVWSSSTPNNYSGCMD